MVTISAKATLTTLSTYGKRQVAASMYRKGINFIAAAILLEREGGYQYVVLHLLCQGIEITLKSLLLYRDYDKYISEIKKIRHDLDKLATIFIAEFNRRPLSQETGKELNTLNNYYSHHLLRYGTGIDLLINPTTIEFKRVLLRTYHVMRIVDRYVSWQVDDLQI